jgi:hypothetical protein
MNIYLLISLIIYGLSLIGCVVHTIIENSSIGVFGGYIKEIGIDWIMDVIIPLTPIANTSVAIALWTECWPIRKKEDRLAELEEESDYDYGNSSIFLND